MERVYTTQDLALLSHLKNALVVRREELISEFDNDELYKRMIDVIDDLRSLFKTPFLLGFDVSVLTEHLQVSPKNPERKASDEYAVSISDRPNRRAMTAAVSPIAFASWAGGPGRPPRTLRLVLNGLLYRAKTGCPWPMLPPTFGPWQTVYGYFNRWRRDGHWPRILDALTRQQRTQQGRRPTPSASGIDAQSVKTATKVEPSGMTPINGSRDANATC